SESAWEEMTCLFAPSLNKINRHGDIIAKLFAMAVYQRHLPERGLMAARVCCRTPRQPRNK
ncbi:hypothetical protein ABLV54_12955, partial [Klebsiella sp. JB_Kp042]